MRFLGTKVLSRSGRRAHQSGWALSALALGAFAIGTAELVVVGILNLVAKGEHVSVSSAGQLVTAYALGIAVGAPLVTALTARAGRRSLLCAALGLFIAGNALAAAATSFHVLLLARVLTGSLHGLFIGVACVIAASLVPPQRRGSAISMVFGGIAVSTVVGVPAGTLIGHTAGWRAAFLAVVTLATVALISSAVLIPHLDAAEPVRLRSQTGAAFAPRVLAALALGFVLIGGQFIAFTYLTALLQRVTHVAGGAVSGFLLIFGIAAAVGAGVGGKAADRSTTGTLLAANLGVVIALKFLDLFRTSPLLVAVWLGAWGFATFAIIPAFQLWVITLAGQGADLAATLGASAVNGGIAVGSLVGGAVLAGHGPSAPLVIALGVSAAAIPLTAGLRFIQEPVLERERRRSSPSAAHVDDHRGA